MKCDFLNTQREPGRFGRRDQKEIGAALLTNPARVCEALPFNVRVDLVDVVLDDRLEP